MIRAALAGFMRLVGLSRLADKLDPIKPAGSGGPGPYVPPKKD